MLNYGSCAINAELLFSGKKSKDVGDRFMFTSAMLHNHTTSLDLKHFLNSVLAHICIEYIGIDPFVYFSMVVFLTKRSDDYNNTFDLHINAHFLQQP